MWLSHLLTCFWERILSVLLTSVSSLPITDLSHSRRSINISQMNEWLISTSWGPENNCSAGQTQNTWVQILPPLLTNYKSLEKLSSLCLSSIIYKMGIKFLPHRIANVLINIHEAFKTMPYALWECNIQAFPIFSFFLMIQTCTCTEYARPCACALHTHWLFHILRVVVVILQQQWYKQTITSPTVSYLLLPTSLHGRYNHSCFKGEET